MQTAPLNEQDAKDVALLTECIEKGWKPRLREKKSGFCVLCNSYGSDDCDDCPVKLYSGYRYCTDTPYIAYGYHQRDIHDKQLPTAGVFPGCKDCETLCTKEIKFLEEVRAWVSSGRKERK